MENDNAERQRLESVAKDSWYCRPVDVATIEYSAQLFSRFWRGQSCLELGPAEGAMTRHLMNTFQTVECVEGSEQFCNILRQQFPALKIHNSLFENFRPTQEYDTIVLGHVLEHVDDPLLLLSNVRTWLKPGGALCAAVPNAHSLHRQAAVIMGMLTSLYDLTPADKHHGHRRVYDFDSFTSVFSEVNLHIIATGGYWIKPVSNAQISQSWTKEMLDAFMKLGESYPSIAAEIYVIATRNAD